MKLIFLPAIRQQYRIVAIPHNGQTIPQSATPISQHVRLRLLETMSSTAEPKPTHVWALYENHPGSHGKLVGIFSSVNHAKSCPLIQPLLQSDWTHREAHDSYLWIASALDSQLDPPQAFYFSVEEIHIDRLAH